MFFISFKIHSVCVEEVNFKFVGDESDLHHGCVLVNYNKLNLCLVDNNLVHFYGRLL